MLKNRNLFVLAVLFSLLAIVLVACGTATPAAEPEEPAEEEPAEEEPAEEEPAEEEPAEEEPAEEEAGEPAACAEDRFGCAVFAPGDTIKIGFAGPTAGDYAAFGTDISQAGLIAIDDFGTFEGWSYELLIEDTGGSPEGGAAVANLFVSNPQVVAIDGHTFSGSTEAAIPIYDEAGLPMLSASATNPTLTEMGSDVFNRIAFTDTIQGENVAAYLYDTLGLTQIAVVHDGSAYGQGLAEIVQAQFEALGGTVLAFEAITPGETDYSAPLAAVAALAPEGLFFGGYDAEAAVLATQLDVAGLGDVVFFSDDGVYGSNFLNLAGENAEGVYATSTVPPSSEAKDAYDAAYEEAYGIGTGSLSAFTWTGYDSVAALISVINATAIVGDDGNLYIPRGALVDAVRGLSGYEGLSGTITCNEVGECNSSGPTFYQVQDGAWVEAPK